MKEFVDVLKEWDLKLRKEQFHGGKVPDAADF